jgi:hypothetical protein
MPKDQEITEPLDTAPLTLADLEHSGYLEVIESDPDGLHYGWSNAFISRTQEADAAGEKRRAKVFRHLVDITSMMLSPQTSATPFLPLMQFPDGRRSPIPEDLPPDVYDWLALVAPQVPNQALRARMADLIWLQAKRHGIQFAILAIESYMAGSLDSEDWALSLGMEWRRALQIAKRIGKPGQIYVDEISKQLMQAFLKCAQDLEELAAPLWYANALFESRCPGVDADVVAGEMNSLGTRHTAKGNPWLARDFFETAAKWYERAADPDKSVEMLYEVARSWEAQGDAVGAGAAALHFYQNAVKALRDLSAAERDRLAGAGALDRVRQKVLQAGQLAIEEMQVMRGPAIEVGEFIAYARQRVQCLRPIESLFAFVTMSKPPSAAGYREDATDRLSSALSRLFSSDTLADDGRVVEKHVGSFNAAPRDAETLSEMVKAFDRQARLVGAHMLIPALLEMQQQFTMPPSDFVFLAEHSPLVPRDRVDLVAKGLHAGFCLDFIQATHILLPQFEHMVRMQLKEAGVLTTTHTDGVDMEIGLSSLVDRPQMLEIFGEDVTFEITALMCHQQGANLRNAVAHGQADSTLCESAQAVYAWWLILRLVVQAFHAMATAPSEADEKETDTSQGPGAPQSGEETCTA